MGIHGIYQEIGKGRRVALSKLSSEIYIANNRSFRLAIDVSIWLFQIQSGKGGSNPALRTFYYRLLRLLCLNIHPLFVFDGPNKPLFKRHKRVGGPGVKVSSIPEFLAKQLLKHFGFPMHHAPGEAEAECALLQREGIVDGVLSEDVDTLMFGSGLTLRSWTPEGKSGKTPTHVNVYDAKVTKETSGLDREGMVLVAMMSGGDYIPEGIPGCGPKLACEAARAGFGTDLCRLKKSDKEGMRRWKERLSHEIRSNESKFFKQKRTALTIPEDFPNVDVLGYYTHPVISGPEKLKKLKDTLKWDMPLDYASLRDFAKDAFDWQCIGGAKKFIRNLAPAMLTRELRLRGEATDQTSDDLEAQEAREAAMISAIHSKRHHASTDGELELRVSFVPIKLVDIDLSIEDPDEDIPADDDQDSDSEPPPSQAVEEVDCPGSPKKKRAPSAYDPIVPEKIWMLGTFVRLGVPLMVQDYEASSLPKKPSTTKAAKPRKKPIDGNGGMKKGALNRFAISMKTGVEGQARKKSIEIDEVDLSEIGDMAKSRSVPSGGVKAKKTTQQTGIASFTRVTKPGVNRSTKVRGDTDLDGLCPSESIPRTEQQRAVPKASSRGTLLRSTTSVEEVDLSNPLDQASRIPGRKRRSPEPASPYALRSTSPPRKVLKQPEVIDLLSSSPVQPPIVGAYKAPTMPSVQTGLRHQFVRDLNSPQRDTIEPKLPNTVTRRRRKAPLKRHRTAPAAGEGTDEDVQGRGSLGRPITPSHDIFEAMDLASPMLPIVQVQQRSLESDDDLLSPSSLRVGAANVVAERGEASRSRFVDRLSRSKTQNAQSMTINEEAIITIESSIPTPPTEVDELDEIDIMMSRKASPSPRIMAEAVRPPVDTVACRAEVSASTFLLANKNLRERPGQLTSKGSATRGVRRARRGEANEEDYNKIIRLSPVRDAPRLESSVPASNVHSGANTIINDVSAEESFKETKGTTRVQGKGKGRFIQPRESLPGAWKIVDAVDLADDHSYCRAFRLSEVEMVDLTGD